MALSRGGKLLTGCLIAVVAAVLLLIVGIALFVSWARTPGVPIEGSRLLDGGTAIYAELRLRSEDPGVRDFVRSFLTATHRPPEIPPDAHLPAPLKWILGGVARKEASDKEVDRILPIVVVLRRQQEPEGAAGAPLFAVSFSRAGNAVRLVDWTFGFLAGRDGDLSKERHGQEDLFRLRGRPTPLWISIVGTDVLISRDPGAVKSGIDSLAASSRSPQAAPGPPSEAPSLLASRPENAFVFLAARAGHAAAVADMLDSVAPAVASFLRPMVGGAGALNFWAALRSADLLEGELRIAGEGAGGAGEGGGGAKEGGDSAKEGGDGAKKGGAAIAGPAGPGQRRAGDDEAGPGISGKLSTPFRNANIDIALEPIPPAAGEKHAWRIRIAGLKSAMGRRDGP